MKSRTSNPPLNQSLCDTVAIKIATPRPKNPVVINGSRDFIQYITSQKKIIIFSSHLDDAVLSMGSLIYYLTKRNIAVDIISVFTEGIPNLSSLSIKTILQRAKITNAKDYFQARREEDIKALHEVGIRTTRHLGYTDAAWRASESGAALYPESQVSDHIDPHDNPLCKKLKQEFKNIVDRSEKPLIFAPLARGRHIDHMIVRDVAATVFPKIIFYEDFPYSALFANEDEFIKEQKLHPVEWRGEYEPKKRAILQYVSQYTSLFYRGPMMLPYEKYYLTS